MSNFREYITSTELVSIPGAKGLDDDGCDRDIAAWRVPSDSKSPHLVTAKKLPQEGDTVFLFGRERGKEHLALFEAKVVKSTMKEFEYEYKQGALNFGGTSGAPVLNEKGEVVAINIGAYDSNGSTIGMGNPLPSIIRMLRGALKEVEVEVDPDGEV